MLWDHRPQELVVRDCGLSSDEHPEEQQRDHAQRDNQEIARFVGIHGEHEREVYDRHRRHQPRHVELIEVGLEVVRPVIIAYIKKYIATKDSRIITRKRVVT